jgi:outer membrane phospholipase A
MIMNEAKDIKINVKFLENLARNIMKKRDKLYFSFLDSDFHFFDKDDSEVTVDYIFIL